jgi:hypothetical protein
VGAALRSAGLHTSSTTVRPLPAAALQVSARTPRPRAWTMGAGQEGVGGKVCCIRRWWCGGSYIRPHGGNTPPLWRRDSSRRPFLRVAAGLARPGVPTPPPPLSRWLRALRPRAVDVWVAVLTRVADGACGRKALRAFPVGWAGGRCAPISRPPTVRGRCEARASGRLPGFRPHAPPATLDRGAPGSGDVRCDSRLASRLRLDSRPCTSTRAVTRYPIMWRRDSSRRPFRRPSLASPLRGGGGPCARRQLTLGFRAHPGRGEAPGSGT